MSGHLYAGDPHAGPAPVSRLRLDVVADVCEDEAEVAKNAGLCAAVLGSPPPLLDPQLRARDDALDAARATLGRLGLEPGGYWVACVGGTAHVSIKTWPPEHWGRVLAECARRYGRRFLFVGLPEELPAARDVRRAMAETLGEDVAARHAALWLEESSTLDDLLALTQLSAGYVGHDTGPMHVAAAMAKPTLGVFGGGTWPRFRPAVDPSVAILVGVPCVGCGWACSFSTSHCIKQVPVYEVMTAVIDMEEGRVKQRETRVLRPSRELQDQMIEEAAAYVRQQVREKATLAGRLREVEGGEAARRNGEALEAVRAELEAARDEAHRASEAAERRAAETAQLRQDLELRAAESQRLSATLEAQTLEVNRLREDIRGILRDVERTGGNGVHKAEQVLPPGGAAPAPRSPPAVSPADDARDGEIARLRAAIERLDTRVRELEPQPRPVRRPLRQVLVDRVIGSKYYPRRPEPRLPRVTVVTPVLNDAEALRATIESVVGQVYPHVEYVVADLGSTDGTAQVLGEFEDRIDRIVHAPGGAPFDAVADAFEEAEGEVLSFLSPGDVLEPGGLLRVGEYFARHRGVSVVYFEDAVLYPGGWKFPAPPQPTADVYRLLALARQGRRFTNGVFFRRSDYLALGPMDPKFGHAADWELFARLARRFELRRLEGQVRSVRADRVTGADPGYASDVARAREAFERSFGTAGRVRCRITGAAHRVFDALRAVAPPARFFFFPLSPRAGRREGAATLPPGEAPPAVPGQPVNPLTDRPPDRLLFSTQDTTGGDRAVHHVYYDSATGVALAAPPLPRERLAEMYAARDARAPEVTPSQGNCRSPYARFAGGLLGRLFQRLPSPYWWFAEPDFADATGDESLAVLEGLLDANDAAVRLLNVGCFDGGVLERFKSRTRWQLSGTETNARAAAAARAKGFRVRDVAPQDAPLELPVGEAFDVVLLTNTVEHLPNPLLILRRLRQLLKPGGLLVLNQPNLDSAHADCFGPTWAQWQVPYHRVLMGRRGLRRMAELADMKVLRVRTRTLPYPACVSVRLNDLGLGAVVPDTARFPNDVASRGVRLTGWSRLLWDWRGRGDFMFAVLRAL
jgi:SAM-dependent methyltransferase